MIPYFDMTCFSLVYIGVPHKALIRSSSIALKIDYIMRAIQPYNVIQPINGRMFNCSSQWCSNIPIAEYYMATTADLASCPSQLQCIISTNLVTLNTFHHTTDLLWEKFQWILPLYMKPISFQSKASIVFSVTAAVSIAFCLKKLNVFSQYIGQKTNEYLNSTEQIPWNWNVDQLSMLITS